MAQTVTPFPGSDREPPTASETGGAAGDVPVQIGDWLFEPSLNRLTGDAGSVRLEPKLTDLLLLLVRHHGGVVSKEEIVGSVWEGRFIADSALTRAMAELRRALGDDAQEPSYIETISKRGYRLIVEPKEVSAKPVASRPNVLRWGIAAGVLVLAASAAMFLMRSLEPPAAPANKVSAIVVLPLQDLSPERGGEYFAAAMTEALTTDLAQIGAFRVLSRRSIDQYAETHGSLAGVASSLGADAAVEGSIVRADGRVRINVQLTDAYTDTHLWAESYERELVDILALQGEVARAIASELSSSVARGFGPAEAPPRVDPLAHDLYLQGRHALGRCFFEGPNEAADLFQRAIDADPGFAPAYAGLADYYSILTLSDFLQPHEGFPKARVAALKALELDPGSAEAHAALAHVEFMFDWNWERADGGFRRALELNPSNADGHRAYAFFLTCMGRFEEAVEQAQLQIELDPLNDRSHLAWVLFNARRHDESLAELERGPEPATLQFAQQLSSMSMQRALVGWNYALLGRHGEAIDILGPVAAARGKRNPTVLGVLGWTLASAGRGGEAREVLGRLEELAASQTSGDLYAQVIVLTALGETERALDLLEETVLQRSPNAIFLAVEPFLESLADEPRYQRLLESVGLSRPAS